MDIDCITLFTKVFIKCRFLKPYKLKQNIKKSKYIERFSVSPFQFPERVAELLFKENNSFTAVEPVAAIDLSR